MSYIEQLQEEAGRLRLAYEVAYRDLANKGHEDPLRIVTTEGRYVLLEALTALVQAEAAIALTLVTLREPPS